jgi:hypothetical protein
MCNAIPHGIHPADNFMPRNNGECGGTEFAVDDMKVGAANATGCDPDAYLPRTGNALRQDHGL